MRRVPLAVGAVGAVGVVIGFAIAPEQAAFSYLTAWAYAVSLALGALIFLMIGYAIGARWVIVFRRFTEGVVATLPLLALMFVPIALSLPWLYRWIEAPTAYLDVPFFLVRAAVYFAIWIAIGELLVRLGDRVKALATAGLPVIALTLTFAAFDWLMSLTPEWSSTVFGLLYFSGGFVGALALIAVIAWRARGVELVARSIHASHTGALGRLMFAFLVFWAYMEFSQGVIIWMANKPDEVPWYVARGAGAWGAVFAVLLIGHFAIPFFALLSRALKRRPLLLAIAGAWLLAMHYVDIYWLVMPVLHPTIALHWLDLAAPLAVLGTAISFATWRTRSPMADGDPQFAAALAYEGS